MNAETKIQRAIREAINRSGHALVARNNVGFDAGNRIPYGLGRGSPDLVGTLRNGVCFCIEVKTPAGRLSREQQAWWRAARKWGIRGGVARSVPEALALLSEAMRP